MWVCVWVCVYVQEGAFAVWAMDDLPLSGDDKALFCLHYGVKARGNVDPAKDPHGELRGKARRGCDRATAPRGSALTPPPCTRSVSPPRSARMS